MSNFRPTLSTLKPEGQTLSKMFVVETSIIGNINQSFSTHSACSTQGGLRERSNLFNYHYHNNNCDYHYCFYYYNYNSNNNNCREEKKTKLSLFTIKTTDTTTTIFGTTFKAKLFTEKEELLVSIKQKKKTQFYQFLKLQQRLLLELIS